MADLTWHQDYPGGRIVARLGEIEVGAVFPDTHDGTGSARWNCFLDRHSEIRAAKSVSDARKGLAGAVANWLRRAGIAAYEADPAPSDAFADGMRRAAALLPNCAACGGAETILAAIPAAGAWEPPADVRDAIRRMDASPILPGGISGMTIEAQSRASSRRVSDYDLNTVIEWFMATFPPAPAGEDRHE